MTASVWGMSMRLHDWGDNSLLLTVPNRKNKAGNAYPGKMLGHLPLNRNAPIGHIKCSINAYQAALTGVLVASCDSSSMREARGQLKIFRNSDYFINQPRRLPSISLKMLRREGQPGCLHEDGLLAHSQCEVISFRRQAAGERALYQLPITR